MLDENDLKDEGRFKMNPPLRATEDRLALIEGIKDGTIDMIATDHAPHSAEEKSKGLAGSAFGITGIELAFPIMYTHLVKTGVITLEHLIKLLTINPKTRFSIKQDNGFTVWNLDKTFYVNPDEFISMGKATPFQDTELFGVCEMTVLEDKVVYKNN